MPFSVVAAVLAFRRWGIELSENGLQRVEPWRKRVWVVFERVPKVGSERASLVIGKVERRHIA
jgi:hypothetical protein